MSLEDSVDALTGLIDEMLPRLIEALDNLATTVEGSMAPPAEGDESG